MTSLNPEILRAIEPRFHRIAEAPLEACVNGQNTKPEILTWQATALSNNMAVLGGGMARSRDQARQIAIAETIERALIGQLKQDPSARAQFGLKAYPTSCGFAAGFNDENVRKRSIYEAIERWARAQWADQLMLIEEEKMTAHSFSALEQFFIGHFIRIRLFSKLFKCIDPLLHTPIVMRLGMVVCFTKSGVFPGAQVCQEDQSPWEHALVEAWRHLLISQNNDAGDYRNNRYFGRIMYFSQNVDWVNQIIDCAKNYNWPAISVAIHQKYKVPSCQVVLWRSLCKNYISWHDGDNTRFVF